MIIVNTLIIVSFQIHSLPLLEHARETQCSEVKLELPTIPAWVLVQACCCLATYTTSILFNWKASSRLLQSITSLWLRQIFTKFWSAYCVLIIMSLYCHLIRACSLQSLGSCSTLEDAIPWVTSATTDFIVSRVQDTVVTLQVLCTMWWLKKWGVH